MKRFVKRCLVPHRENNFRPHLLKTGGVLVFGLVLGGLLFAGEAYRLALRASDYFASVLPSVLADMANEDRTQNKLGALAMNSDLAVAAKLKASDMASKGYFAHVSPEGLTPWDWFRKAGYNFSYAGENLAVNFSDSAAVNLAWMNSPAHRANILNGNFTEVGIATAEGEYNGRQTTFVVEMFGRPSTEDSANFLGSAAVSISHGAPALEPIASTSISESDGTQTFLAVRNTQVTPAPTVLPASISVGQSKAGTFFSRILSSPSALLGIFFILLILVLLAILIIILKTRHNRRLVNTIYVLLFIVFVVLIYISYSRLVLFPVEII